MKRLCAFFLALMLSLAGCGSQAPETHPDLILRYADNQPPGYPTTQAAAYFAELVKTRTNGRIEVRVYDSGRLGSENSVFEQLQFGGVDFTRISSAALAEYYTQVEVLLLPYLYTDSEHMWRVLDGEIGQSILDGVSEAGAVGLCWFDAGARSFYTRQKVTGLADLQNLTIRVQESRYMSRLVEALGARTVQIAYGDVYSALQTAAIDGAENNWSSYESMGHYEAAPYYLLDEHSRIPEMVVMSPKSLEKVKDLDPAFEEVLRSCAQETGEYERELWAKREADSEEKARKLGCIVTELSDQELLNFQEAVKPIYDGYPEEIRALIRRIREA